MAVLWRQGNIPDYLSHCCDKIIFQKEVEVKGGRVYFGSWCKRTNDPSPEVGGGWSGGGHSSAAG